jgi:hypothetical protein
VLCAVLALPSWQPLLSHIPTPRCWNSASLSRAPTWMTLQISTKSCGNPWNRHETPVVPGFVKPPDPNGVIVCNSPTYNWAPDWVPGDGISSLTQKIVSPQKIFKWNRHPNPFFFVIKNDQNLRPWDIVTQRQVAHPPACRTFPQLPAVARGVVPADSPAPHTPKSLLTAFMEAPQGTTKLDCNMY